MARSLTGARAAPASGPDVDPAGTEGPSLTSQWARSGASLECSQLPAGALAAVRRLVLDTVACAIAGVRTEAPAAVLRGLAERYQVASGGASVWGTRLKLPAAEAAMVNGTAAHARELDDFGGCGHSGAVVIPAVLAAAEEAHASGKDVVVGIVAGYEVSGRALDAVGGYKAHNDAGWHSTGTCGALGAAAGVARTLGLSESQVTSALGIAGSFTGGIWSFIEDGAMTKRWHPGKAAHTGVQAAWLAQAGFAGPRYLLEAPWGGFVATYSPGSEIPTSVVGGAGEPYRVEVSGMKPYAACRGTHSSIDALLQLIELHGFGAEDVVAMTVHGDQQTVQMLGGRRIANVLDAQFSLPYCLAVVADTRRATVTEFDPPRSRDPRISDLIDRIAVLADSDLSDGEEPELEVRLRSGSIHRLRVAIAKGDYRRPLTDQEVMDKAASLAEPIIGARAFAELARTVDQLPDLSDVSALTRFTQSAAGLD